MAKTLIENFFNWFRWRPKISKPLPVLIEKPPKEDTIVGQMSTNNNSQIIVTVLRARNVPNRAQHISADNESEIKSIQPFVRIDYKSVSVKTNVARGTDPVWNQDLYVPLE